MEQSESDIESSPRTIDLTPMCSSKSRQTQVKKKKRTHQQKKKQAHPHHQKPKYSKRPNRKEITPAQNNYDALTIVSRMRREPNRLPRSKQNTINIVLKSSVTHTQFKLPSISNIIILENFSEGYQKQRVALVTPRSTTVAAVVGILVDEEDVAAVVETVAE